MARLAFSILRIRVSRRLARRLAGAFGAPAWSGAPDPQLLHPRVKRARVEPELRRRGSTLEMKSKMAEPLALKYEHGMPKYPLKVVKKA